MSYLSSLIKSKILETDFEEIDSWIVKEKVLKLYLLK